MFNLIEFIEQKRDGGRHSDLDFSALVDAVTAETAPDYQLAAWLMAAYFNGLDDDEIKSFTEKLGRSGNVIEYPKDMKIVDKHSAGGVGDKTTLVLVPLVAACGAYVSKLSGPGLGYTGGTVDKLESIPGMKTHLNDEEFRAQIYKIGCAISGHSKKLAPAEGKFYKLRDVTGTVPSIPLITSSILSKKLAGGAHGYVFDVKCGDGAFMNDFESASALAEKLVAIAKKLGRKSTAIISDMEQPLGEWVGNSVEVLEAIQILNGGGPDDTKELCVMLAAHMLTLAGVVKSVSEGREKALLALDNGEALKKFEELVTAQGGRAEVCKEAEKILPMPKHFIDIKSDSDGYVAQLAARKIGEGLRALGGGRLRQEDIIDHSVYVRLLAKIGDKVKKGDAIIRAGYNSEEQLKAAEPYLASCWQVGPDQLKRELILGEVQ